MYGWGQGGGEEGEGEPAGGDVAGGEVGEEGEGAVGHVGAEAGGAHQAEQGVGVGAFTAGGDEDAAAVAEHLVDAGAAVEGHGGHGGCHGFHQ